MRHNPHSGHSQGYYRLVESYRNEFNRICHRTLLNIGFVDTSPEKLNSIRGILNDRLNRRGSLFEEQDPEVAQLADHYWEQLVAGGKIDVSEQGYAKKQRMVDVDTLTHNDAREVGAEWMCFQGIEQLNPKKPLGLFCPPGRPRQGCTGQALKINDLAFLFKVRIPVSFKVGG
ncbi:MAG: hypothetical protein EA359_06965 [Balneolaceae bacterium]|nr:MAG: hypothetical protein EA359_06965 [Balneolaceae bacterium]